MLGIAVPILVWLRIPGGLPYPHVSPLLCPRSDAQIFRVFQSCHVWPGEVPTQRFEDESDRRNKRKRIYCKSHLSIVQHCGMQGPFFWHWPHAVTMAQPSYVTGALEHIHLESIRKCLHGTLLYTSTTSFIQTSNHVPKELETRLLTLFLASHCLGSCFQLASFHLRCL